MATDVPADLVLSPIGREPRTIAEWTTMFHLALVVLDPYTYESSWILDTATRVLRNYAGADCRVAFLVTADEADTRTFLGPLVDEFLVLVDPDRWPPRASASSSCRPSCTSTRRHAVEAKAEGWHPDDWREVAENLATRMSWARPDHPGRRRPHPLRRLTGTGLALDDPALGHGDDVERLVELGLGHEALGQHELADRLRRS